MRTWTFQDSERIAELGDRCPWSVGWYDPDGKRKRKAIGSKSRRRSTPARLKGQLAAGVYRNDVAQDVGGFQSGV